jgi:hypothetical protein
MGSKLILAMIKKQGFSQRQASLGVFPAHGIYIGHQLVAEFHKITHYTLGGIIEKYGFRWDARAMRPQNGRKGGKLQPSRIKLLIFFAQGQSHRHRHG